MMNLDFRYQDLARASSISDAQCRLPYTARSVQGEPQQTRVRLKKKGDRKKMRFGTWNVVTMTGKAGR